MRVGLRSPFALGCAALAAAFLVHLLMWEGSYQVFSESVDHNRGALEDFMGVYMPQALQLSEGGGRMDGFLYSPFFAWILQPLAALGPFGASWTWLVLQLAVSAALLALGARWVARVIPEGAPSWLGPVYIFVGCLSFPLVHNLHWGQVSGILGLLVLAAAGTGSGRVAGVLIGAAAAIKFYPALFLFLLLFDRDRRGLRWGVLTWLGLSLAPALQLGWAATWEFYLSVFRELGQATGLGGEWISAPNNQSLVAACTRWFPGSLGVGSGGLTAIAIGGWVVACLHLFICAQLMRLGDPRGRLLAFLLLVLSLSLILSPSWPHYFVLLPFGQLLLVRLGHGDKTSWIWILISAVLSFTPLFWAVGDPEVYGSSGLLLLANLALLPPAYRCAWSLRRVG